VKHDLLVDSQGSFWAVNCRELDGMLSVGALVVLPSFVQVGALRLTGDSGTVMVLVSEDLISKTDRITVYNAKLTILQEESNV
jgi:hypothetical protein